MRTSRVSIGSESAKGATALINISKNTKVPDIISKASKPDETIINESKMLSKQQRKENPNSMDQVTHNIYIGNIAAASDESQLKINGITHIINTTSNVPPLFSR